MSDVRVAGKLPTRATGVVTMVVRGEDGCLVRVGEGRGDFVKEQLGGHVLQSESRGVHVQSVARTG